MVHLLDIDTDLIDTVVEILQGYILVPYIF